MQSLRSGPWPVALPAVLWSLIFGIVLGGSLPASGCQTGDDEVGESGVDPVKAWIDTEMQRAMNLVNDNRLEEAIEAAREVWKKSADGRVGFALIQLLEKKSGEDLACEDVAGVLSDCSQAAELARQLLADGALPEPFRVQLPDVLYREAVALARMDDSEAAFRVLDDAFLAGFARFDLIAECTELGGLDATRLQARVEAARREFELRMREQVAAELKEFRSFEFAIRAADVEAEDFDLTSLRGKVVVINFWGTWCPLCQTEIESLVRLKREWPEVLEVVGLAYENGDPEQATTTVRKSMLDNGVNYRCLLGDLASREAVPDFAGFPATLFLDRSGRTRLLLSGPQPYEKLVAAVQLLSAEDQ